MSESNRVLVLFGSQTFTAQEYAERIWRSTKAAGFNGPVQAMDDYPISKLIQEQFAIFVCSTTGKGEEPDNMKKFWKFLLRKNLPTNSLVNLKYGVIGLGDSSYPKFNYAGKRLHKRLKQLGATALLDIGLCDYQHDLGHDAVMQTWLKEFYEKIQVYFPNITLPNASQNIFIPKWKVSVLREPDSMLKENNNDIYFSHGAKDSNFIDAIHLEVESNERITDKTHFQDVRMINLRVIDDKQIKYEPGDVFNIRPRNLQEDVQELFSIFELHKMDLKPHYKLLVEEYHADMPVPEFLKTPLTLQQIAEQYWDLKFYPTQYVFSLLALVSEDKLEREKCIELSSPEGQEDWLNYCRRPKRTILEVLQDFHKSTSKLTIDVLFELFFPIKPRSFSIASSCLPSNGRNIELLVAVVEYTTKLKKPRLGLCSNWMKRLKVGFKVYGWIKKGTLWFPSPSTPHILIGPGTGLAPFRSLIQERVHQGVAEKDSLHLFFGCRNREKDLHCKEELQKWEKEGKLSLYCAFSRDQEKKVYVQHKIAEHRELLWSLLNEKNAYIFISGNSKNMPDNVKDAFVEDVFCKTGGKSLEESRDIISKMEDTGRLQLETWG